MDVRRTLDSLCPHSKTRTETLKALISGAVAPDQVLPPGPAGQGVREGGAACFKGMLVETCAWLPGQVLPPGPAGEGVGEGGAHV